MQIVLLEPLGIKEEKVHSLASGLSENGHEFIMYNHRPKDEKELIERAKDADVVLLANMPFRNDIIRQCSNLKMISVAFTGLDHIGISACKEKGIVVRNAAGYSTPSVAELAFGLMISVLRNIVKCDAAVRAGSTKDGLVGYDLCGKTLGIVGTGAIGMKVAEIGRVFGCRVIAYSRTEKEEAKEIGVKYVDLDTLMAESDIVSLHVPLNDQTQGIISKDKISLMKPSAILINTARGPIVDNTALADALKQQRIAGAGIDVFDIEPPISSTDPLLNAPNTVLTPHVAFATKEALERRAEIAFRNITEWLNS
jgi:phosphoglycerate dehydrogenase-like enzyme